MKKHLIYIRFILPLFAVGILATSCNDDDDRQIAPPSLIGSYEGSLDIRFVSPTEEQPTPEIKVLATVDADSVYIKDFPVAEIIKLIVSEQDAEKIVETIGQVDYSIVYQNTQKEDAQGLALTPDPLIILLPGASPLEEEHAGHIVKVIVEAPQEGTYTPGNNQLNFNLGIASVSLDDEPLDVLPKNLTFGFAFDKSTSEN